MRPCRIRLIQRFKSEVCFSIALILRVTIFKSEHSLTSEGSELGSGGLEAAKLCSARNGHEQDVMRQASN